MIITLIDETKKLSESDLQRMVSPMRIAACNIATAWNLPLNKISVAVMTVEAFRLYHDPGQLDFPIVFTDEESQLRFLADHRWDEALKSAACRVFVKNFIREDGAADIASIFTAATHELEALANPRVNRWMQHPDDPSTLVALEICDPVQADTYDIDGLPASDFVTPFWFDPVDPLLPATKFSWTGRAKRPGEIRPGGYSVQRDGHGTLQLFGNAPMDHPHGRARRILEISSRKGSKP